MEASLGALAATLAAKTEEESADFFLVTEIREMLRSMDSLTLTQFSAGGSESTSSNQLPPPGRICAECVDSRWSASWFHSPRL